VMRGQVQAGDQGQVSLSDSVSIVLKDLGKLKPPELVAELIRVIDVARDAGLTLPQLGQPALAEFQLSQPEAAQEKAYAEAMKDARSGAERLARLAGVKLGEVHAVQVISEQPTDRPAIPGVPAAYALLLGLGQSTASGKIASQQLAPISVEVKLRVLYHIAGAQTSHE